MPEHEQGIKASQPRPEPESWHELFDRLCDEKGLHDIAELASQFCAKAGQKDTNSFYTASRNLRNWRTGKHLPSRRNYLILSKVLDTGADPALQKRWAELYALALRSKSVAPEPETRGDTASDAHASAENRGGGAATFRPPGLYSLLIALGGLVITGAGGYAVYQFTKPAPVRIPFVKAVDMQVGDVRIIHGKRGFCGKPPPSRARVQKRLPAGLKTGRLEAGALVGERYSVKCRGRTPARAVLFHATAAGKETFRLYGDRISVTVRPSN